MIIKNILFSILIFVSVCVEAQNNYNNSQQVNDTVFDVIYTPTGVVLNQFDTIYNVQIKVGTINSVQNVSSVKVKIKSLEHGNIIHDFTIHKGGNNLPNLSFNHLNNEVVLEINNINPIDFDYEIKVVDNNGIISNSIPRKY